MARGGGVAVAAQSVGGGGGASAAAAARRVVVAPQPRVSTVARDAAAAAAAAADVGGGYGDDDGEAAFEEWMAGADAGAAGDGSSASVSPSGRRRSRSRAHTDAAASTAVTMSGPSAAASALREAHRLRTEVGALRGEVLARERVAGEAQARLRAAKTELREVRGRAGAAASGAAELAAAEAAVKRASMLAEHSDAELADAQQALLSRVEALQEADDAVTRAHEADAARAAQRAALEDRRAERTRRAALERRSDARAARERTLQRAVEVERDTMGAQEARQRLAAREAATAPSQKALDAAADEHFARRVSAALSLKSNVDEGRKRIQATTQAARQRQAKQEAEIVEQRRQITEAGGNPYEIQRRLQQQQRLRSQLEQRALAIKRRELEIAQRVLDVDLQMQKERDKRAASEAEIQAIEAALRPEGVALQREQYLRERTGRDILDPSGRKDKIYPSEETALPTWGFGLGRTRADIVDKEAGKLADVAPDMRFVPVQHRAIDLAGATGKKSGGQARAVGGAPATASAPAASASAAVLEDEHDEEVMDHADLGGLWERSASQAGWNGDGDGDDDEDEDDDGGNGGGGARGAPGAVSRASNYTDGSRSALGGETIAVRELTVLEKSIQKRALQRQKENIVVTQEVCGRVLQGPGFLSSPLEVLFKDFDVGKTYKKKIVITNVSNTLNSFKILPLSESVQDFFAVDYKLPGHISAGLATDVTITFAPKLNEDLDTVLPCLAQTGAFEVPIRCRIKRVAARVDTPSMAYGTFIQGDTVSRQLTIVNDGALACDFAVSLREAVGDELGVRVEFEASGRVEGYGSAKVTVTLHGDRPCILENALHVDFAAEGVPSADVPLTAEVSDLPIFVENETVDLQTIFYDQLWRRPAVLRNRGKVALRCTVDMPAELREYCEFAPSSGFIQAAGRFEIMIKLTPTPALLERCAASGYVLEGADSNVIQVPVRVNVPDQPLPVFFVVRARLTAAVVDLSPAELDFGNVVMGQTATLQLALVNRACVPQRFGFFELPAELSVLTGDGYGMLLPGESTEVTVGFTPSSSIEFAGRLSLRTVEAGPAPFRVRWRGVGVRPLLALQHTSFTFRASPLTEPQLAYSFLQNTSKTTDCRFAFTCPPGFIVAPAVGVVPAGCVERIVVKCDLPAVLATRASAPGAASSAVANATPSDAAGDAGAPSSADGAPAASSPAVPFTERRLVPLVCEPVVVAGASADDGAPAAARQQQFIEVQCCAVGAALQIDAPEALSFGAIAIGQRVLRSVRVTNISSEHVDLHAQSPSPFGAFTLLNAPRPLSPGGYVDLLVAFLPSREFKYRETLRVWPHGSEHLAMHVPLAGDGVSPKFAIEPAATLDGVDLGDVVAVNTATKQFTVVNQSSFQLPFKASAATERLNGMLGGVAFGVSPTAGVIEPGQSLVFTARYAPTQGFVCDAGTLTIEIAAKRFVVPLRGRCWSSGLYVRREVVEPTRGPLGGVLDPTRDMSLELRCVGALAAAGDAAVAKFVVGHASSAELKATGEFTVEGLTPQLQQLGFSVEPAKGTLAPGATQVVTVTCKPPANVFQSTNRDLGPGQLALASLTVRLKGGVPPPPAAPGDEVRVAISALVSDSKSAAAAAPGAAASK